MNKIKWIRRTEKRPLSELVEGEKGIICKMNSRSACYDGLREQGLAKGTHVAVVRHIGHNGSSTIYLSFNGREAAFKGSSLRDVKVETVADFPLDTSFYEDRLMKYLLASEPLR